MAQEQSQKHGEPPIGQCTVCGDPVTRDDSGALTFSAATGSMTHVHTRCKPAPAGPSDESLPESPSESPSESGA